MLKWLRRKRDPFPWLTLARGEIGVKEMKGKKHNPQIIQYHLTTSYKATSDEVSWCSAFVNWCLLNSGFTGTNNAAARSWLKWGRELKKPQHGCITILWRRSPKSWQGHVGFFIDEDHENVFLLGGNQKDSVCIRAYPKNRVLGYRWPHAHS